MKNSMCRNSGAVIALVCGVQLSLSQGTFVNLAFEGANVPSVPPNQSGGIVSVGNGLPGWAAYIGASQIGSIFHNDISLGAASISILGPQWGSSQILQGSYTVLMQPAFPSGSPVPAIAQTGTIPASAQSVRFYGNGVYTVMFAGQQIPVAALGTTVAYTIFGGDISAYADQTGELRFQGGGLLDNIFFSSQAIPEPSVFGLLGLGTLLFMFRSCLRDGRERQNP